jgi:hypothetical protein
VQRTDQEKSQINLRMPKAALLAINKAASQEDKSAADYLRIAGLAAACHTFREIPLTVFIAPGEKVTLSRAESLGMRPVAEVGGHWEGEVRVQIGKNGVFNDSIGGIWVLTVEGLKAAMTFDPAEEAQRLEVLSRTPQKLESRSPYKVIRPFTAFIVEGEGFAPMEHLMKEGWTLFADPEYWKGKLQEGREVVRFFFNTTPLYVDRKTFLDSARRTVLHS